MHKSFLISTADILVCTFLKKLEYYFQYVSKPGKRGKDIRNLKDTNHQ